MLIFLYFIYYRENFTLNEISLWFFSLLIVSIFSLSFNIRFIGEINEGYKRSFSLFVHIVLDM